MKVSGGHGNVEDNPQDDNGDEDSDDEQEEENDNEASLKNATGFYKNSNARILKYNGAGKGKKSCLQKVLNVNFSFEHAAEKNRRPLYGLSKEYRAGTSKILPSLVLDQKGLFHS